MADTTPQPVVYIGSHLKAEAFYGMSGDPDASSLLPGETVKRGSVGKSLIKGVNASADPGTWQTRDVSAKPLKAKAKGASAGGKIPSVLDRGGGPRPAAVPAKRGNAKR